MPMMIKAGIDGWHGIQPSIGIDLAKLKEIHGDDLSLWGGLDYATLVAGTPDDVQKEALRDRTRGSQWRPRACL